MSARKKASPQAKTPRECSNRIELTQRAISDLKQIEDRSIREWGRQVANAYLDGIAAALDRLRSTPTLLRPEPDLTPGLYFYRVQKHFLVCDLSESSLIVLTVIHTSMDIPARLLELEPCLTAEIEMHRRRMSVE